MPRAKSERRSQNRIPAEVPVSIRSVGAETASGLTRDLSTGGIFLYTDASLQAGSELEMVLTLPPELMGGEKQWVCCRARVVRVENGGNGGRFGVAADISEIIAMPEIRG